MKSVNKILFLSGRVHFISSFWGKKPQIWWDQISVVKSFKCDGKIKEVSEL